MPIHKARGWSRRTAARPCVPDNSFKLILGNHELFVQFLRDFIPIDILKNVKPEDIEDMVDANT
jgi:hypothetical protein